MLCPQLLSRNIKKLTKHYGHRLKPIHCLLALIILSIRPIGGLPNLFMGIFTTPLEYVI